MTNDNLKLLIPIVNHTFEEGKEKPTVNARDLYNWLEIKTPFSVWIKQCIEEHGFKQGVDFTVVKNDCDGIDELQTTQTDFPKEQNND